MGTIKWYKRDPDAALSGMMGLNLEERGAYNTVLDLIYTRDGNLPDDDRFIAGWLGVDVRVWRRIKDRLIALGKLYLSDGTIHNRRADVEVLNALSRVGSARDAGKASALAKSNKSHGKSNKNNDIASTAVGTDASTTVSTNHNHNQIEEEGKPSPSTARADDELGLGDVPQPEPAKPKRAAKAKRQVGVDVPIPENFEPRLGPEARRIVDGWPPGMLERETFAFRSHAQANGRLAKDWNAAFGTWISKTEGRRVESGNRGTQAFSGSAGYSGGGQQSRPASGFLRRALEAEPSGDPGEVERRDDCTSGGVGELPYSRTASML